MEMSILAPAAVLVLWSLVMLFWLAFARFSAAAKLGSKEPPAPGLRGQDIDPLLGAAAWKSHNYTHLMEQPTIFYAAVFILFLTGAGDADYGDLCMGLCSPSHRPFHLSGDGQQGHGTFQYLPCIDSVPAVPCGARRAGYDLREIRT